MKMEEQLPPSMPAPEAFQQTPPPRPTITPEMVEQMKMRAREEAIRITMEQRQAPVAAPMQTPNPFTPPPQVVYIRRNLTLAELLVTLALACGLVFGVQAGWNFASQILPRIEVKVK
jgi:hypothetical protein